MSINAQAFALPVVVRRWVLANNQSFDIAVMLKENSGFGAFLKAITAFKNNTSWAMEDQNREWSIM